MRSSIRLLFAALCLVTLAACNSALTATSTPTPTNAPTLLEAEIFLTQSVATNQASEKTATIAAIELILTSTGQAKVADVQNTTVAATNRAVIQSTPEYAAYTVYDPAAFRDHAEECRDKKIIISGTITAIDEREDFALTGSVDGETFDFFVNTVRDVTDMQIGDVVDVYGVCTGEIRDTKNGEIVLVPYITKAHFKSIVRDGSSTLVPSPVVTATSYLSALTTRQAEQTKAATNK